VALHLKYNEALRKESITSDLGSHSSCTHALATISNIVSHGNDPSAGLPMEARLQLLYNEKLRFSSRKNYLDQCTNPWLQQSALQTGNATAAKTA